MPSVKPPAKKRPHPRPPSPEQMARIVEAAWKASNEWGLYVWLSAITGARRGEVIALQWNDIDSTNGILRLDENYRGRGIYRRDDEYGDARNYHHTGRDGDYQCEMPAEYVPVLAQGGLILRRGHGRSAA